MDMILSKLQEIRGACHAAVHGVKRVGHNLVTLCYIKNKQQGEEGAACHQLQRKRVDFPSPAVGTSTTFVSGSGFCFCEAECWGSHLSLHHDYRLKGILECTSGSCRRGLGQLWRKHITLYLYRDARWKPMNKSSFVPFFLEGSDGGFEWPHLEVREIEPWPGIARQHSTSIGLSWQAQQRR